MNTTQPQQSVIRYSIEYIRQQRMAKKAEIDQSARRMQVLADQLFAPQKSVGKIDNLLQHVNAGIAAYDGVMTGLKVLRRVQSFFRKKKK